MKSNRVVRLCASLLLMGAQAAFAGYPGRQQQPLAPMDQLQLLRKDILSARKQAVAANMKLTASEAERFWPVYDQFAEELMKVADRKLAVLKEYAQADGAITHQRAQSLLEEAMAAEDAGQQVRRKYVPLFQEVLSGRSTALFYQIEARISLMIELDLASQIPLIEP